MFWGLIMEPGRRYTQLVKKSFHVSMASLDVSTSSAEAIQVMLVYEGRNYLLCTLKSPQTLQVSLDLEFRAGTEISFATNGEGHVHLTGYLTDEFDELDGLDDEEEDEEEEDEEVIFTKGLKRAADKVANGKPAKKSKAVSSTQPEDDDSDENSEEEITDEEDDDDLDADGLLEEIDEDDDDDEEEEDDEDDDGEEEEDEDDEEEEEEEQVPQKQSKKQKQVNGVAKPETDLKGKKLKQQQQQEAKAKPGKKTLQGGVIIEDLQEGQGQAAKNGKFINVYYEGRLKSNNKMFDSLKKGAGFNFRLGAGEVIKGWDVGIAGMRPGGKRRITCPPNMAYGPKGSPPTIPPNSTLVFEVEMKKIK